MHSPVKWRPDHIDPYNYTTGRWLKDDKLQRTSRRISFDFGALCEKVTTLVSPRAQIVECVKQEGASNRVFLFTFNDGHEAAARLPMPIAGPARLTTHSEVATIEYIRAKTDMKLPRILDWSDDSSNAVGAEYIIFEKVPGIQLATCWDSMSSKDHILCIKGITTMLKTVVNLTFPAYGSIYFVDSPRRPDDVVRIDEKFCVGSHCGPLFWNSAPGERQLYGNDGAGQGPWPNLTTLCNGLIASSRARLPPRAHAQSVNDKFGTDTAVHQHLIAMVEAAFPRLIEAEALQKTQQPMLMHPDLNQRNIFVSAADPTQVTGIIDWQSSSILPMFMHGQETPDFAMPPWQAAGDGSEEDVNELDAKTRKDLELCHDAFEVLLGIYSPTYAKARMLDRTYLRLFLDCNTSWRDGAAALRQDLIDLADKWPEMGLPGKCPYQISQGEREKQKQDYEDLEVSRSLRLSMQEVGISPEGWVASCDYEETLPLFKQLYGHWLDSALEESTLDRAEALWPYDKPDELHAE